MVYNNLEKRENYEEMNDKYHDLFDYFKRREKSFLTILEKLVTIQTYSGEKENINGFLDFLEELFSEFYIRRSRFKTHNGDVLSLLLGPDSDEFSVLLAHVDTVKVSDSPVPVKIENNRFFANGCYDMKSGIALFYFAVKALKQFGLSPGKQVRIIFSPDEETGSKASLPILLQQCAGAAAVILPEPCCPDGGVKTRRKGVTCFKAQLTGKAAHSGIEPEKGIDANRGLAKLIIKIDNLVRELGDVTFNPGIISGGKAGNVVSPASIMEFEVRSYSNDLLKKARQGIEKIAHSSGARCNFIPGVVFPALEFDDKNKELYEKAKKIAKGLDYDLPAGSSGGGSEGSHLSAAGVPVIDGIGIKGGNAHAVDEYIDIQDFSFRAALITALCIEV